MPYFITVYDWSLYTTSLSQTDLETSSHGNDPGQTGSNPYDPGSPTWTGVDFTYNGTGSDGTLLAIDDDDAFFEDAYVETGGAQTLDQDVTINGVNYFAGDVIQNEFSLINAGGVELWVVRINGVNVGFAYPAGDPPSNGEVFNANDTRDGAAEDSLDQTTPSLEPYQDILCFAAGTRIATPGGAMPVEELRAGDRVDTLGRDTQRLTWVYSKRYRWPAGPHSSKPIAVRAGSLGAGLPKRDLVLSPQHRVLLPGGALAPAVALTILPGIRQMNGKRALTLVHAMCADHSLLLAEGAPCESFYPGDVAKAGLPHLARRSVAALTGPEYASARPFLTRREAERLLRARGHCWDDQSLAAAGVTRQIPCPASEALIAA
ncbi:MAG: Hint domain-containing protein [Rhodobacter sp.]|nr:Hint domain-containing protein [Rhodobacter sp.]